MLLLNVLPGPTAARLKEDSRVIADRFESVTVLFADVVNYTKMSATLPPEDVVVFLNDVFSRFDNLTAQYGLEKIKTMGDSYMVAGGILSPRADHAVVGGEVALRMSQDKRPATARATNRDSQWPCGRRSDRHEEVHLRPLGRHGQYSIAHGIARNSGRDPGEGRNPSAARGRFRIRGARNDRGQESGADAALPADGAQSRCATGTLIHASCCVESQRDVSRISSVSQPRTLGARLTDLPHYNSPVIFPFRNVRLALAFAITPIVASGANFTVNSSNDAGSGTLRQAILDANATPGPDVITFPTTVSPLTIELATPLPPIEDAVTLRAPVDQVRIDGRKLSAGNGLTVIADHCVISGLVIFGVPGHGIEIRDAATVSVSNCVVGLTELSGQPTEEVIPIGGSGIVLMNARECMLYSNHVAGADDGMVFHGGGGHEAYSNRIGRGPGNRGDGIVVEQSASNLVGAWPCYVLCPTTGNEVESNGGVGIVVHGDSNLVFGNYVGVVDWGAKKGNASHGIELAGESNVISGNDVRGNGGDGIRVTSGSSVIESTWIGENGGLPIDLAGDGATPNDSTDADSGPNGFQNYPILDEVITNGHSTRFIGTLSSAPNTDYKLEPIGAPWCEGSFGESSSPRGARNVTTDEQGIARFDIVYDGGAPPGAIAATATGPEGTSEAGRCVLVSSSTETRADLSLRQTPSRTKLRPREQFTIDVEIVNNGPAPSGSVRLKNLPPSGAQIVRALTTSGDCYLGVFHECSFGGLPPGAQRRIRLELVVTADAGQEVTNVATAINDGGEPDPVTANGSSTLTLPVEAPTRRHPTRP